MKFIIGVDGGGTKTESIAYALDGTVLSKSLSGFGNLLVNEAKAIDNIVQSIEGCFASLNKEDCEFLFIGLAGYGGIKNLTALEIAIKKCVQCPFEIVNDVVIAHAALLGGADGVLTIAGTGSASLGKKVEKYITTGGWGHLLGDEGSGNWICMRVFKRLSLSFDEIIEFDPFLKSFADKLGIKSSSDLKRYIYQSTKDEISSHVPFIVEAAKNGEEFARSILEEAGRFLASVTCETISRVGLEENPRVAVKGSILTEIEIVRRVFSYEIEKQFPQVEFFWEQRSSAYGGFLLAMKIVDR